CLSAESRDRAKHMSASRFSMLQARVAQAPRPSRSSEREVVVTIPNSRKQEPEVRQEQSKASNRVLEARIRIHRMLIEEINLVALERLPKDEMRRQVHDFVTEKTREERMAINTAE